MEGIKHKAGSVFQQAAASVEWRLLCIGVCGSFSVEHEVLCSVCCGLWTEPVCLLLSVCLNASIHLYSCGCGEEIKPVNYYMP